jgi:hypothetical protein
VPPPFETRPCLNCQIPIRIDAPDILCPRCLSRSADDYIRVSQNIRPCYDCTNPFPARPGVIRCFNCRTRRAQPVQAIPAFDTASFDPFINTFQPFAIQPRPTSHLPISQDSRLCYDCHNPFPAQTGVIRCSNCRAGRTRRAQPASPLDVSSFNPLHNSLQLSNARKRNAPSTLRSSTLGRQKSADSESTTSLIRHGLGFLQREFDLRMQASDIFPPVISLSSIRSSVARYENCIAAVSQETSCCSCGRLVPLGDVRQISNNDPLLQPLQGYLDICGWNDGLWNACSPCYSALFRRSIPKFSSLNKINVSLCQCYPAILSDLTLPEECLIAKCHPVGVVLKLRPGGRSSPVSYRALRGHFIVVPQDPSPLLQILPSPELRFTDLIKVIWLGKRPPVDSDLRPFLLVRKHKVFAALQYLVNHNPLYRDVLINHSAVDSWADDFIPPELQDHIICINDTDHHERAGYTVDLENHNYENDWQAAEDDGSDPAGVTPLLTGSVTTDINGERQNPDMRILSSVYNIVNPASQDDTQITATSYDEQGDRERRAPQTTPVIKYTIRGQATLLNHWQDSRYFLTAFPTLFPMGVGGHLDERPIPVSPAAFADWALRHHSRRHGSLCIHTG